MVEPAIYHVLDEAEPFSEFRGGAISRWVANIVASDANCKVICPDADDSWGFPPERIIRSPSLEKYGSFQRRTYHKLPWPLRAKLLQSILTSSLNRLNENDIVWFHNRPDFTVAMQPFIRARRARIVLHMHNSFLVSWKHQIVNSLAPDLVVFVSNFLKDEAQAKWSHFPQSVVLYNGADEKKFFPTENVDRNDICRILIASRLVPQKGVHVFLRAMELLQRRGSSVQGLVLGSSAFGGSKKTPYIEGLHKSAPSNVVFEGYLAGNNLACRFREANIFCLPSVWQDPFPLSVLEAMASAIPVVATRSGGIPEALAEGGGILVERDSVQELASGLEQLAGDWRMREEMGLRGLTSFRKNFTWSVARQHYCNIIGKLTG